MYFGRKNGETVTLSPGDTTAFAISTIWLNFIQQNLTYLTLRSVLQFDGSQ
jgi:hypothetical protein